MRWKRVGWMLFASLASGLFLGVGGRVVMRLIALGAGVGPGFSIGGSLEVVATGLMIGTPAALAFAWLRRYVADGGVWGGAVFGALLFVLLVLVPPPAARSAFSGVGHPALTLSLFGSIFVLYGVIVDAILTRGVPG